jgi:hypothetical protein
MPALREDGRHRNRTDLRLHAEQPRLPWYIHALEYGTDGARTRDLRIDNPVLYLLSYGTRNEHKTTMREWTPSESNRSQPGCQPGSPPLVHSRPEGSRSGASGSDPPPAADRASRFNTTAPLMARGLPTTTPSGASRGWPRGLPRCDHWDAAGAAISWRNRRELNPLPQA